MKEFLDFLAKDFPEGNKLDGLVVVGYGLAQTLIQVLKQCGAGHSARKKPRITLRGFSFAGIDNRDPPSVALSSPVTR
jgi:hypothetical protein